MNLTLQDRAREISDFLGKPYDECLQRLQRGFAYQHQKVAADWRAANPQTDEEILEWYRNTTSYIWELSAYHADAGYNYSGMCEGIANALHAKEARWVLCLGDGIGDLTIHLRKAVIEAVYHDMAGSRTAEFAGWRMDRYLDCPHSNEFSDPERMIVPRKWEAIVSLDFLEHVTDVPAWLRAIYAALKPGGWALIQNAFGIGSGPEGSIPCHLARNDRYEVEYGPLMLAIGFEQEGTSNWWRKGK